RTSEWKPCGIARSGHVRPGHPRSMRIGNAAGAVDPIGGEGIGLALWSGTLLGSLLATSKLDAPSLAACERRLRRAYRARLRVRAMACRGSAELLMRPRLLSALWP